MRTDPGYRRFTLSLFVVIVAIIFGAILTNGCTPTRKPPQYKMPAPTFREIPRYRFAGNPDCVWVVQGFEVRVYGSAVHPEAHGCWTEENIAPFPGEKWEKVK